MAWRKLKSAIYGKRGDNLDDIEQLLGNIQDFVEFCNPIRNSNLLFKYVASFPY